MAVLLAAFGYLGVLVVKPIVLAALSRSWLQAEATVVTSLVEQNCSSHGSFSNVLVYHYAVDGRQFEGNRESFSLPFCGSYEAARDRAAAYVQGKILRIRFNASRPEESVVEAEAVSTGNYIYALFFLLVFTGLVTKALPEIWRGGVA